MEDLDLNGATELREGRREMVSGQIKKTPYGEIRFKLKIDMPGRVSEDDFKKYMREYGEIVREAFSK
jgi:hypothetical protein